MIRPTAPMATAGGMITGMPETEHKIKRRENRLNKNQEPQKFKLTKLAADLKRSRYRQEPDTRETNTVPNV